MTKKQKKARARRRSQEWAAEKVLFVLSTRNPHHHTGVLRHGNSLTWYHPGPRNGGPA